MRAASTNGAITHILFATELSENPVQAGLHAVAPARVKKVRVHLLHGQEPPIEDARVTLEPLMLNERGREDALHQRREMVERVMAERQEPFWNRLAASEARVREQVDTVEVIEKYPAETMLRRARTRLHPHRAGRPQPLAHAGLFRVRRPSAS